jgi:hypothetical protein
MIGASGALKLPDCKPPGPKPGGFFMKTPDFRGFLAVFLDFQAWKPGSQWYCPFNESPHF